MANEGVKRGAIIGIFLILLYISYLILKPFMTALLGSFFLTYLLYPVYKKINRIIRKDYLSSAITTALMVFLILLPIFIITTIIFNETVSFYNSESMQQISEVVGNILNNPQIQKQISENVSSIVDVIEHGLGKILTDIPLMLLSFLIMILTTFYLFISGPEFLISVKKAIPFKRKDDLIKHVADTTYSISYGFFVIAFFEFLVAAIGFTIIGLENPFLWAVLVGFSALLPVIGPFLIVFVPLWIIEIAKHSYYTALALVGVYLIIGYLENISRPKIIGKKAKVHPIVIIIGMIGGIGVFGIMGVIVGPIILSLVMIIIEKYYYEYIKE